MAAQLDREIGKRNLAMIKTQDLNNAVINKTVEVYQ
jgi:hypothetical protein